MEEEQEKASRKKPDCIKNFTQMRKAYGELHTKDARDHPIQQNEVPDPRTQRLIMLDKVKG